jgi:hypothetical protein
VASAVPFRWIVELEINPVPVAVRLSAAPPAMAELGLTLVTVLHFPQVKKKEEENGSVTIEELFGWLK